VKCEWVPDGERNVDDIDNRGRGSGGGCIRGWVTTGEPDEPAENFIERMM